MRRTVDRWLKMPCSIQWRLNSQAISYYRAVEGSGSRCPCFTEHGNSIWHADSTIGSEVPGLLVSYDFLGALRREHMMKIECLRIFIQEELSGLIRAHIVDLYGILICCTRWSKGCIAVHDLEFGTIDLVVDSVHVHRTRVCQVLLARYG